MDAYLRKDAKEIADNLESVLAHFPRLIQRLTQAAGTMSGGEQQMLAMGCGKMSSEIPDSHKDDCVWRLTT